jgi:hypothetical protein
MTQTETMWTERVRRWRGSGQTAEQFAQGQGFAASTLRYWASRLGGRASAAAPTGSGAPSRDGARMRLVRVRRVAAGAASARTTGEPSGEGTASAALVVTLGRARIEVCRGFDPRLLSDVVEALGGAR